MKILGIESSHDDTSFAVLENSKIIFHKKISQTKIHQKFGGTIPEIASREHTISMRILFQQLEKEINIFSLDAIAYTAKPGLIGPLQIGYLFAKGLSDALEKPLYPIDHLEGHIFSVALDQKILYPALALVISGGHSQFYFCENPCKFTLVSETLDDAVGEIYDKIGRKLGFDFPAGKIIDHLAKNSKKNYHKNLFATPKTKNPLDFSFSGIKTQALNLINKLSQKNLLNKEKFCKNFQDFISKYIEKKIFLAAKIYQPKSIVIAGGVSANFAIRNLKNKFSIPVLLPNLKFTTDNGAMIAKTLEIKLKKKCKL